MTTIATDGSSMAGDGLACVEGYATTFDRVKVHRLDDGSLLGCAGDSFQIAKFRAWLIDKEAAPTKLKDFCALHLQADGTLLYYADTSEGPPIPSIMNVPAAIGSGNHLAIGALEAGASPEEAVRIACKRDTGSGGTITVLHLGQRFDRSAR